MQSPGSTGTDQCMVTSRDGFVQGNKSSKDISDIHEQERKNKEGKTDSSLPSNNGVISFQGCSIPSTKEVFDQGNSNCKEGCDFGESHAHHAPISSQNLDTRRKESFDKGKTGPSLYTNSLQGNHGPAYSQAVQLGRGGARNRQRRWRRAEVAVAAPGSSGGKGRPVAALSSSGAGERGWPAALALDADSVGFAPGRHMEAIPPSVPNGSV
ncbi:hypothetical protein Taro_031799, partial [Colocasia esculenta]|nr:hypothetical protein [Colocasia esculenta]